MALGQHVSATEDFAGKVLTWAGAYLISFVGLVHLLESAEHFGFATYLGFLFLANFAASVVTALGMLWTGRRWAWLLGVAVAGGALVGFLVSRVVGLPAYPEVAGQWFNFTAWFALALELTFLAVTPLALTERGRTLVGAEQRRIDREELPPSRQETPEHFGLLEGEMREIRDRMAPDLSDLRAHLDPRVVGERARQDARSRLRKLLRATRAKVHGQ